MPDGAQFDPTSPFVTFDTMAALKEMSRQCGLRGITDKTTLLAQISALTDAQTAAFTRAILAVSVSVRPPFV